MTDQKMDSLNDKELLFNLFRFLSFIQDREASKQFLDDQVYYLVTFPVVDFIRYLGLNERSHYQRNKILGILQSLQTLKPVLNYFDDIYFRSSVMFPYVKIQKKGQVWIGTVAIGEQLLSYKYPYHFTNYFTSWKDKYQCQVKFQVLQTISTSQLEKQLSVENFLKRFNVPNKKQTEIKQLILESLNELINSQLLQSQLKIIKKDGSVSVIQ